MRLNEVINELKHKSLRINIWYDSVEEPLYSGTVGTYLNWIGKDNYGILEVDYIGFNKYFEIFEIYLIPPEL